MAYRTIDIEGKTYRYSVGRTHTKIVDVGVFENSAIGNPVRGEMRNREQVYVVTPRNVRHAVLGLPVPRFEIADGSSTHELAVDPCEFDLGRRTVLVPNCPEALARSAADI